MSEIGTMGMLGSRKARVGLASAVVLAAAALWLTSGPSIDRARQAYDRRNWSDAASIAARLLDRHPLDVEATRIEGRALARLERPREAAPRFARLGGAKIEAEDLFLIGEGALLERRGPLARVALEAAVRLDPKRLEASEALDRVARGSPGSSGADRLLAVADPSTLSELIVGLAAIPPGGDRDPILDGLLRRDRASFVRLGTPADARKLLARGLLEEGMTAEARGRLEGLDDPEASWLRGRALLVEGELEAAKRETAKAGEFGLDDPIRPEPARYVGASKCAGCHREIYRDQQSSHHSATVAWADGLKHVPLPDHAVPDPENPGVEHRFDRSDAAVRVTSKVDGKDFAAAIEYAMGSGNHGMTMLGRGPDGRPRSLRISYYAGGKHWGLTSGYEPKPVDPWSYVGEVLNEESFRNCLNCHTTRFTSERGPRGPEAADRGIGCERCHGPGDHHVRAMEGGFDSPAIARPRLAKPQDRMKLCAQCHASDGVIPPADPRFIRFQAATLPYSRCLSETGGKLDCVSCHDPHRDVETSPAYYEARCLACHSSGGRGVGPSTAFRFEPVAAGRCPVDPVKGCVSCHMPKVDNIMPFTRFTDHHIRVRRPGSTAQAATSAVREGR